MYAKKLYLIKLKLGLGALYAIWPGNGLDLFSGSWGLYGPTHQQQSITFLVEGISL